MRIAYGVESSLEGPRVNPTSRDACSHNSHDLRAQLVTGDVEKFTTIMVVMATTTTMMKDLAMCGRGWDACHTADHHHHGGGQDHGEAEAGQKEFEHNQETRKFRRKMNRYI